MKRKTVSFFILVNLLIAPGCYAQPGEAPVSEEVSPGSEVSSPAVNSAAGQWSDGWYEGAEGYGKAVEEYKSTNKPMVVYVSVTWCPYCRKFEKEVLSSEKVREFLKDKIKVNLNPESGRAENSIARQYGVRGFPSFFLHPPAPGQAVQLYTGVTPDEFIQFFSEIPQ